MERELRGLFERYADAFNRLDAEAIAAFYRAPCLLVAASQVAPLLDDAAILANMRALLAQHREQKAGQAAITAFRVQALGPTLALATVGWRVEDLDAAPLWQFENSYELVRQADDWKIVVSTTHG